MVSSSNTKYCVELPPKTESEGIWRDDVLTYSLPLLQVQILIVFATTEVLYIVLKRFGIPKFVSQVIAGIVLNPEILGSLGVKSSIFKETEDKIVETVGMLGFCIFMLVSAAKIDLGMIKTTGRKALIIGCSSFFVSLGLNTMLAKRLSNPNDNLTVMASFHSTTSFPVVVSFLTDMKLINSELGRLGLYSAVVSDLGSFTLRFILASMGNTYQDRSERKTAIGKAIAIVGFIAALKFVMRPAMFWLIKQNPAGRPIKQLHFFIVLVVAFSSGLYTNLFGQAVVLGLFFFGLAMPDGPPLGSAFVNNLEWMSSGIFLPFFVSTTIAKASFGFNANTLSPDESKLLRNHIILAAASFGIKMIVTIIPQLFCKMSLIDSVSIALIMNIRGIVELLTFTILKSNQNISGQLFGVLVISILVVATIVPLLLNALYDPTRKYAGFMRRSVMHMKHATNLRMLLCIYRAHNITSMINLIDATYPTPEEPANAYILHLIEMIARATPIFISHQLQNKMSERSYSGNVIISFDRYQRKNFDAVKVNTFTAVSSTDLMHETICNLALDNQTAIIVLPFHQKLAFDGSVESEDAVIRKLNTSVMQMSPCSVAILIDRSHLRTAPSTSHRVCMIFVGGNDDREGLALAKRMARNPSTCLTVVHLLSQDETDEADWEKMHESEPKELKEFKQNAQSDQSLTYMETIVKDASETSWMIQSMATDYDLLIVGRRYGVECPQTSGLLQFSDFPELGPLGDLTASRDICSTTSVLIIQQQQTT